MTGDHLNLVGLHHLVPSVVAIGHAGHVALVGVDQLTEVLRVDRHSELEAFSEFAMHINDISSLHTLGVSVANSIESLLE